MDVAGSRIRYADTLRTTAVAITPEVTAEWPRAIFRGSTSVARLTGGETSFQGLGDLSLYTRSFGPLAGELELFGGGTRIGGTTTSQLLAVARAHLTGSAAGGWIGGGGGTANNGVEQRASWLGEAGAWAGRGVTRASLTVTPTVVEDSIRYTDINLIVTTQTGRVELAAFAGSRSGSQPEVFGTPVKAWASASLISWFSDRIALVAAAGRYPVDLTQGFPGGTYGTLGLRIAVRDGTAAEPTRTQPAATPLEAAVSETRVASSGGTRKLIFFRAPAARTVEIAGEFTQWQPVQMTRREDGWWSIELSLAPGIYRTSIRLDGGPWQAPAGLLAIRDEFGGEEGLLDVP